GADDLARDGEPEARVLATDGLGIGAVSVEAIEDDGEAILRNAGTFVLHGQLDGAADAAHVDRHRALLWRERDGVVDEVGQHLAETARMAADQERALERRG